MFGKGKGKKGKGKKPSWSNYSSPELKWGGDDCYAVTWDSKGKEEWTYVTSSSYPGQDLSAHYPDFEWSSHVAQDSQLTGQWIKLDESCSFVAQVHSTEGHTDVFEVFLGNQESTDDLSDPSKYALLQRKIVQLLRGRIRSIWSRARRTV